MINQEKDSLCKELETTTGLRAAELFIRRIKEGETDPLLLYSIAINHTDRVGFRAGWILEKLCEQSPDYADLFADRLIADFYLIRNTSTLRVLAKLLGRHLKQRADLLSRGIDNYEGLIERSFEALIARDTQFSVKQMCCELLLLFKDREDWIREELQVWCDSLPALQQTAATTYRRRLSKVMKK